MYTIEFYYATQFNLDNSGNLNFKFVVGDYKEQLFFSEDE